MQDLGKLYTCACGMSLNDKGDIVGQSNGSTVWL